MIIKFVAALKSYRSTAQGRVLCIEISDEYMDAAKELSETHGKLLACEVTIHEPETFGGQA